MKQSLNQLDFIAVLAVAMPLLAAQAGSAAIITGLPTVTGPGTPIGTPTAVVNSPNNDDYAGDGASNPNQINFIGINISGFEPIDFLIPTGNSGGTTEYFLSFGTAVNQTGVAWSALRVETGTGTGASFLRTTSPVAGVTDLDFDFPTPNPVLASSDFPAITHVADQIVFSGGNIAPGDSAVGQNFSFDLPDITTGASTYDFTIRLQAVAIPEPGSLAFLAGCLAFTGILMQRRRRRSSPCDQV